MGQYWCAVNLDKREYIHPHAFNEGAKLWEIVVNRSLFMSGLALLIADPDANGRGGGDWKSKAGGVIGRWYGDRVVLSGDCSDDAYGSPGFYEDYTDISSLVLQELASDPYIRAELREAMDGEWCMSAFSEAVKFLRYDPQPIKRAEVNREDRG